MSREDLCVKNVGACFRPPDHGMRADVACVGQRVVNDDGGWRDVSLHTSATGGNSPCISRLPAARGVSREGDHRAVRDGIDQDQDDERDRARRPDPDQCRRERLGDRPRARRHAPPADG